MPTASDPQTFTAVEDFISEHVHPLDENLREVTRTATHALQVTNWLKRRNIAVERVRPGIHAFVAGRRAVGGARSRVTTLVSHQALEASDTKSLARAYFAAQNVPVVEYQRFAVDDRAAAEEYAASLPSVAVKPDAGWSGQGLRVHVQDEQTFQTAWTAASKAPTAALGTGGHVLIEPVLDALTLRFYIVGHEIQAASVSVPLYVVGDGQSTVAELVDLAYQQRLPHRMLRNRLPEESAQLLELADVDSGHIPHSGDILVIRRDARVDAAGLPVDVTGTVHADLKTLALDAFASIPALGAASVTMMTPSLDDASSAAVAKVNARASAMPFRYPAVGEGRRATAAIADQIRTRGNFWDRLPEPPE